MQIGNPPTCPADVDTQCSGYGEWKGEFFPNIPKIKYEVERLMTAFVSKILYCSDILHATIFAWTDPFYLCLNYERNFYNLLHIVYDNFNLAKVY